jgi:protein tyrosine phosphatase
MQVWQVAASILAEVPLSSESMQARFRGIDRRRPIHLTTISARKRKNEKCNRYQNILPFDQNCVKVRARAQQGSHQSTYVNASFVQVRWLAFALASAVYVEFSGSTIIFL